MRIFLAGCIHGYWDLLLQQLGELKAEGKGVDLAIINGDTHTFRNEEDMKSAFCPKQYRLIGSFWKIYKGIKKPPCKIIIIGGKSEATELFFKLPYGGWITPDVFYVGRASHLQVGKLSLVAISGIYKHKEFYMPINEDIPLIRPKHIYSAIHTRVFSILQALLTKDPQKDVNSSSIDIVITSEWPSKIPEKYAEDFFIERKPIVLKKDHAEQFGIPYGFDLINTLQPKVFLSGQEHLNFETWLNAQTKFIAVGKIGREEWFHVIEIEGEVGEIMYNGRWLSILRETEEYVKNPQKLKYIDLNLIVKEIQPKIKNEGLVPTIPFNPDPVEATQAFREKYGINIF